MKPVLLQWKFTVTKLENRAIIDWWSCYSRLIRWRCI